jgi:NLI interacting factor-like phosphatase
MNNGLEHEEEGKLFIVLDINGTLLDRKRGTNQFFVNQGFRHADFSHDQRPCWCRPYLYEFLDYLFTHFSIGIWTSMTPHNAYSLVGKIFQHRLNLDTVVLDDGFYSGKLIPSTMNPPLLQNTLFFGNRLFPSEKEAYTYPYCSSKPVCDWLNPASVYSRNEACCRANLIKYIGECKRNLVDVENKGKTHCEYSLKLLWTQRRCIIRQTTVLDHATFQRSKPVMIKHLSLLWNGDLEGCSEQDDKENKNVIERLKCLSIGACKTAHIRTKVPSVKIDHIPFFPTLNMSYSPQNTLLIDDSEYKFGLNLSNGLAIPEYTIESDVANTDCVLLVLIAYLERYRLSTTKKDIRDFIHRNPFDIFLSNYNKYRA